MAAVETFPQLEPRLDISELLVSLLLTIAALWILNEISLQLLSFNRAHAASYSVVVPLLLALAFGLVFWKRRYAELSSFLRVATRSSAIGILAFLLLEPVDFTLANDANVPAYDYLVVGYYVALVTACASILAPSFTVPTAIYVLSTRQLVESVSGLPMSLLDMRYMIEMALFTGLFGVLTVGVGARLHPYFKASIRQDEIAFIAFGLHLANYFWSGIAKMSIGPYPWTWLFENRTANTIPYSLENGTLPIGGWPWLTQAAYDLLTALTLPLNAAILGFQLFAIICVLRISWLKIASIAYDIFHLGIWLFGGLFFWPWIWNNASIYFACRKAATIPVSAQILCVVSILCGAPGLPFQHAAWLGWFDILDARQSYLEAVLSSGEHIRVPPSFFLSHSYSVSHGEIDRAEHAGHYPHTWWGSSRSYERNTTSGTCPDPNPGNGRKIETEEAHKKRIERIRRFVVAHHRKMLDRPPMSFYVRFHHHPSNPMLFRAFNEADLQNVIGYNLVVDSVCHSLEAGEVKARVVMRSVDFLDVR